MLNVNAIRFKSIVRVGYETEKGEELMARELANNSRELPVIHFSLQPQVMQGNQVNLWNYTEDPGFTAIRGRAPEQLTQDQYFRDERHQHFVAQGKEDVALVRRLFQMARELVALADPKDFPDQFKPAKRDAGNFAIQRIVPEGETGEPQDRKQQREALEAEAQGLLLNVLSKVVPYDRAKHYQGR